MGISGDISGATAGSRLLVRRDDLPLIDELPGMWAVARGADLRIFWISRSQERMSRLPREQLIGASLYGKMPAPGAEERERVIREVMTTGVVQHLYQAAFTGQRVLCTVISLDPEDFGHTGVVTLMRFDPSGSVPGARTLQTPRIFADAKLATLTRREMEILHPIAEGLTSAEIGVRIGRSERTVSQHLRSIHTKLGTRSRSELMFLTIEGGISGFSAAEWAALIDGEMRMREAAHRDRADGVRGP